MTPRTPETLAKRVETLESQMDGVFGVLQMLLAVIEGFVRNMPPPKVELPPDLAERIRRAAGLSER